MIGVGENGNYIASDTSALLQATRKIIYLEEGDVAEINTHNYRIVNCLNNPLGDSVERTIHESALSNEALELGPYAHFMQKEIFEQPIAVGNTLEMVFNAQSISPNLFGNEAREIFRKRKVFSFWPVVPVITQD